MTLRVPRASQVERWSDEKFASEYAKLRDAVVRAGWKTPADMPTFYLRTYSVLENERLRRYKQLQLF